MDASHRPVDRDVAWGVHTFEGDDCAVTLPHHAGMKYFSVSCVKTCHELLACIAGDAVNNSFYLVCSGGKVGLHGVFSSPKKYFRDFEKFPDCSGAGVVYREYVLLLADFDVSLGVLFCGEVRC